VRRARFVAVALVLVARCSKHDASPPPPAAAAATPVVQPGNSCPATGLWQECSLIYHLERAGVAPKVDSGGEPLDKTLSVKPVSVKIGQSAVLDLYIYPDSAARIADSKKLDRSQFVDGTALQTMKRERTLIESANVIGLLTSLNSHQRERVSDAITAGPPQPAKR
jgi:hypothetical protein